MYITICKIDDQCMKQGTQSRCSGTTQRDRVGREVARGVQDWGTQVHLWLIRVNVLQTATIFQSY